MTTNTQADAARLIQIGATKGLQPRTTLAIVRSVTNLGPEIDLGPTTIAVANAAGAICYAGTNPADLMDALEEACQ